MKGQQEPEILKKHIFEIFFEIALLISIFKHIVLY